MTSVPAGKSANWSLVATVAIVLRALPRLIVLSAGGLRRAAGLATESRDVAVQVMYPLVAGAPGHGCSHNTMCTAASAAAISAGWFDSDR